MIPQTGIPQEEFEKILDSYEKAKYNNKDFRLVGNRIKGFVDGEDSLAQAIYFILSVERFKYRSMSENVGVELWDLYGESNSIVELALATTLREAILADDRVDEISNLEIERLERNSFLVKVEVLSNIGNMIEVEKEVTIDG